MQDSTYSGMTNYRIVAIVQRIHQQSKKFTATFAIAVCTFTLWNKYQDIFKTQDTFVFRINFCGVHFQIK